MKYCPHCGLQVADDDDKCIYCGEEIESFKEDKTITYPVLNQSSLNHDQPSTVPFYLAVTGLILVVLFPLFSLILGLIGLKKARQQENSRSIYLNQITILLSLVFIIIQSYLIPSFFA